MVIGGTILCNRTIQELKKATTDQHDMMQWLQNNHIYIEADSLGTTKICTVGYLFNVHPTSRNISTANSKRYQS